MRPRKGCNGEMFGMGRGQDRPCLDFSATEGNKDSARRRATSQTNNNNNTNNNTSKHLMRVHCLFCKYSEALTTTAVTKDRVLGHNPVAALYTADSYYSKLKKSEEE